MNYIEFNLNGKIVLVLEACSFDISNHDFTNNEFDLDKWTARTGITNVKIYLLKQKLKETDYQAIKFAEGELSAEDYEPIKQQRRAWRAEINKLEAQ